eukprot:Nitzschia sp. Nitz4//scaffold279_size24496//12844//13695//NITZ4_008381-RA/size24496-processed-gene-0.21-mRNA-1//-1//CDS//3329545394//9348//frame0
MDNLVFNSPTPTSRKGEKGKTPLTPYYHDEEDDSIASPACVIAESAGQLQSLASNIMLLRPLPSLDASFASLASDIDSEESLVLKPPTPTVSKKELSAQPCRRKATSVRFSEEAPTILLSEEDSSLSEDRSLWWKREDFKTAQQKARKEAQHFSRADPNYSSHFCQLYQDCTMKKNMSDIISTASAIHILTTDAIEIRGLELRLLPDEESSVLRRNVHSQTILMLQKQLRSALEDEDSDSQAQEAYEEQLGKWSAQSSRPSRTLARILATGDALHVSTMHRNM